MQLYRYLRELSIAQPVRQRPARFPSDTAARILKHLGLPLVSTSPAQLPTLAQLKQERAKARKGK
jgi:hypothetical protein